MTVTNRWVVLPAACLLLSLQGRPARGELGVQVSPVRALNVNAADDAGFDGFCSAATDGHGNWVAVWASEDSLGGTIGTEGDILVARSVDNGENWSIPVPLNTNAATDTGRDMSPRIATDGNGNWVVVWTSKDSLGNTIGTDEDILFARSTNNGANWTAPKPLNSNAATDTGVDGYAQVACDSSGHCVAVFESTDSLGGTIGNDRDVLYARSIDSGANWSNVLPLNSNAGTDAGGDSDPSIATSGQGRWVAVWDSPIGGDDDILFARSIDNGANWSAPAPLNANAATDAGGDAYPEVACDTNGNCVTVWHHDGAAGDATGTDRDILVARSIDNGANWSLPIPVKSNATTDDDDDSYPSIATDGVGNWVAAWESSDSLGGTIGDDYDILVARSIDNGAHWSNIAPFNSNAATDAGNDGNARVISDAHGNWLMTWDSPNKIIDVAVADYDVHTARFALPDCNDNLIADSTEVVLGLLPDLNFNNIPDICELLSPPPNQPNGCGAGLCGTGMAPFVPFSLIGIASIRRVSRRRK